MEKKDFNSYKHIENITKKRLANVKLELFKSNDNGNIYYNLIIDAFGDNNSTHNVIVLNEEQKNQFMKIFGGKNE